MPVLHMRAAIASMRRPAPRWSAKRRSILVFVGVALRTLAAEQGGAGVREMRLERGPRHEHGVVALDIGADRIGREVDSSPALLSCSVDRASATAPILVRSGLMLSSHIGSLASSADMPCAFLAATTASRIAVASVRRVGPLAAVSLKKGRMLMNLRRLGVPQQRVDVVVRMRADAVGVIGAHDADIALDRRVPGRSVRIRSCGGRGNVGIVPEILVGVGAPFRHLAFAGCEQAG